MTFARIDERREEWPITLLCRVLEVSRSGFYAWWSREVRAAEVRREELTDEVKATSAPSKRSSSSKRTGRNLSKLPG